MSLPDADRHARAQIEHHREQMGVWKHARAERIAAEYEAGKSVEDIATELNVSTATVYEVMRAARPDPKKPGRKKRGAQQRQDAQAPTSAPQRRPPLEAPFEVEEPVGELVSEPFEDPA